MTQESEKPLVLYDEACPLCRMLADFGRKRASEHLSFVSWQQEVGGDAPPELSLRIGEQTFEGADAWERLLETYPKFQGLGWLAAKLGLTKQTAAAMNVVGHGLRRACFSCPSRLSQR